MFPKTLRGSLKLTFSNSLNPQPKPCPVVCSVPSISLNFFVFFSRNLKEKSCVYSSPFLVTVQSLKLLVALRFSNKQQTVLSFFFGRSLENYIIALFQVPIFYVEYCLFYASSIFLVTVRKDSWSFENDRNLKLLQTFLR